MVSILGEERGNWSKGWGNGIRKVGRCVGFIKEYIYHKQTKTHTHSLSPSSVFSSPHPGHGGQRPQKQMCQDHMCMGKHKRAPQSVCAFIIVCVRVSKGMMCVFIVNEFSWPDL